ncbi:MAG: universal stress protein [Bacteroidota bacterium]|nr:universal stress protein [Bacteroidota bacterium]MDP3145838.1 universal stress protein [Bacteroidota bacterium]MDP3558472.1 universal stress protein [Bacteroidota bacterium]
MESLKVLIPTDFSVQAEYAYLMVKKLEEKIPVEIHFLHVLNVPDTVTMDKNGNIDTCGEINLDFVISQKNIAERKLNDLKTIYGESVQTHFVLGKVTDQIVMYSEQNKFDLIAMGTKGSWGIKETLSGSEVQVISRHSKIPLLSLMCDRSDLLIENVLLVHDFTNSKNENLDLLHKLISAFNTKAHLLQIITDQSEEDKKTILQKMDLFATLNSITNYEKHLLNDTDIESGVIHFNQMHEMDIICIGNKGKSGFLNKSTTEKLVAHLFKPIISFHLNN